MNNAIASSANKDFLCEHSELLIASFFRLTGRHLIEPPESEIVLYQDLYNAPFCVLSHGTEAEPIFNYGNKAAQELFEMSWSELTQWPSRQSAEAINREERDKLLARVNKYGFIDNYKGVRISATGRRFLIEDSVVWNLIDENGVYRGQAAVLYQWSSI